MCSPEDVSDSTQLKITENEDNESLMEKCWHEEYKGASRKWLIRDASVKILTGPLCSTMKQSYMYPERENSAENNLGRRKKLLMEKFYQESSEEVINELKNDQQPNDYCTEYDGNYNAEGFKPKDIAYKRNTQLFQKYPLYSSPPVSYYSFRHESNPSGVLHGLTRITDRQNIFKRNGQFSKPISESYDFVEL